MSSMSQRERIRTALQRDVPDRVPMLDITFWPDTIDRWYREGLPLAVDPCDYFGMDHITQFQFDRTLRLPTRTIEETDEWVVSTDSNGATRMRWKHRYAPPGHQTEAPAVRTRFDDKHEKWMLLVERRHHGNVKTSVIDAFTNPPRFVLSGICRNLIMPFCSMGGNVTISRSVGMECSSPASMLSDRPLTTVRVSFFSSPGTQ